MRSAFLFLMTSVIVLCCMAICPPSEVVSTYYAVTDTVTDALVQGSESLAESGRGAGHEPLETM